MNYIKIDTEDVCNGNGLRCVIWLSSCNWYCRGCQNPQTWNPDEGILFDEKAKEKIFQELNKDYISGITLTGGDPLHENNLDGILDLTEEIRLSYPNKTIWLYTGYTWESIMSEKTENDSNLRRQIVSLCDVIIDGRYIEEQRDITLKWRGSKNQRVIDVKKTLENGEIVLWET